MEEVATSKNISYRYKFQSAWQRHGEWKNTPVPTQQPTTAPTGFNPLGSGMGNGRHVGIHIVGCRPAVSIRLAAAWGMEGKNVMSIGRVRKVSIRLAAAWGMEDQCSSKELIDERSFNPLGSGMGNGSRPLHPHPRRSRLFQSAWQRHGEWKRSSLLTVGASS